MKLLSKILTIASLAIVTVTTTMASNADIEKIDAWLNQKGLNKFGDEPQTMYMGGNPLFNESTGQAKDRVEYLEEKFPGKPWNVPGPGGEEEI